jgi:putative ABC transport system permease protein
MVMMPTTPAVTSEGRDSGFYKAHYYEVSLPKDRLTKEYLEHYYGDSLPAGDMVPINVELCLVDDGIYAAYIKELGLDPQKYAGEKTDNMIALTKINIYDDEAGRYASFDILQGSLPLSLQLSAPGEPSGGNQSGPELTVTYIADRMPATISESRGAGFLVLAPYSLNGRFSETRDEHLTFTFSSTDPAKSTEEMNTILKEEGIFSGYSLFNIARIQEQNRNMIILINVFSYGFILLISLIAIANVFNTVSTNINLRRREFAVLKSVGMSDKGFNKMMNFECVFYGLKSLLYGLPVAFLIIYLIYRSVMTGADVPLLVPWMSVAISVFSVFLVVFVTMMYSASRVKKENTADALRNEAL